MVRERGLEPPRPKALAPKASVSTNSTTRAYVGKLQNHFSAFVLLALSVTTIIYRPPLALNLHCNKLSLTDKVQNI
jgi:hypothetical protein